MILKDLKDKINNNEHFEILNHILDKHDFTKVEPQKSVYVFLKPFISFASRYIRNISFQFNFDRIQIEKQYRKDLATELMNITVRCLILEIHIKKLEYDGKEQNSSKRLALFLHSLSKNRNSYEEFFSLYEQLLILLLKRLTYFIDNFLELVSRLNKDHDLINHELKVGEEEKLISIDSFLGDSHNNGLIVSEIVFQNSSIIYKPRNNYIANAVDGLLVWLSENSSYTHYSFVRLDFENYSWEEKVIHTSCETQKDISEFYTNLGYIAGVLYFLNGIDFHYENLIAYKQHPILVDNETLLQPDLKKSSESNFSYEYTVLSTSLFPDNKRDLDISGLTGDYSATSILNETIANAKDDQISIIKEKVVMPEQYNIPLLNNEKIKLNKSYKEKIVQGFRNSYMILYGKREFLSSESSPLMNFEKVMMRVLFRPTMKYHELMIKSTHPDYIKGEYTQNEFVEGHLKGIDRNIMDKERLSILNFDIPYFYTYADELNIYINGDIKSGFRIDQKPFDSLLEKLSRLSTSDCEKQIELIEKSIEAKINE